jgi:peptidoglycan/LPS O-acetylase OafA/YrhL
MIEAPRASAAIGNLRAIVVLIVVAVHCVIAYLVAIGPTPCTFDSAPWCWRTFPVVDAHRFIGFDIFCAWADAYLMALFFLVSGFFVWTGLERGGAGPFVQRRTFRLAPRFLLGILLLMPIANYPAYLQTMPHPGLADYVRVWFALPFWPAGPMWFLWFLLAFDVAVAALFGLLPRHRSYVRRLSLYADAHPLCFLAGVLVLSELAYFPFGYPFGPMNWFQFGPFSFQLSFPGLYFLYFCVGIVMGACGLGNRLLAADGPLARHWKSWTGGAAVFFALWLFTCAKTYMHPASAAPIWKIAEAIALPPACLTSCCCVLAATIHFANIRSRALDSLQRNSFEIYMLHCVFVVWTQYALLTFDWPAILKAAIVFVVTLAASWAVAAWFRRLPRIGLALERGRRTATAFAPVRHSVLPSPGPEAAGNS